MPLPTSQTPGLFPLPFTPPSSLARPPASWRVPAPTNYSELLRATPCLAPASILFTIRGLQHPPPGGGYTPCSLPPYLLTSQLPYLHPLPKEPPWPLMTSIRNAVLFNTMTAAAAGLAYSRAASASFTCSTTASLKKTRSHRRAERSRQLPAHPRRHQPRPGGSLPPHRAEQASHPPRQRPGQYRPIAAAQPALRAPRGRYAAPDQADPAASSRPGSRAPRRFQRRPAPQAGVWAVKRVSPFSLFPFPFSPGNDSLPHSQARTNWRLTPQPSIGDTIVSPLAAGPAGHCRREVFRCLNRSAN